MIQCKIFYWKNVRNNKRFFECMSVHVRVSVHARVIVTFSVQAQKKPARLHKTRTYLHFIQFKCFTQPYKETKALVGARTHARV